MTLTCLTRLIGRRLYVKVLAPVSVMCMLLISISIRPEPALCMNIEASDLELLAWVRLMFGMWCSSLSMLGVRSVVTLLCATMSMSVRALLTLSLMCEVAIRTGGSCDRCLVVKVDGDGMVTVVSIVVVRERCPTAGLLQHVYLWKRWVVWE